MASTTAKRPAKDDELKEGVRGGSAYCALALSARKRPLSVEELIAEVGGLPDDDREVVFNAAADGFNVFDDARTRGLL